MRSQLAEQLDLPRLSLSERDHRWEATRKSMLSEGIDCLLVSGLNSGRADSGIANARYLTSIGGNGEESFVVFALNIEPTCFILTAGDLWWTRAQDWVKDVRRGPPDWIGAIARRIQELGVANRTLGVVGLTGTFPWENGNIPYTFFVRLQKALPEAKMIDSSKIVEQARYVKSPEVVEFHRKAAELGDAAVEAMTASSRPGVREYEVYADMVRAILRGGGEHPVMIIWEAGPQPHHPARFPTGRRLKQGDIILNEISPKYAGCWAHPHQPVSLGVPPSEYRDMFEVCLESYQRGLAKLTPGIRINEAEEAFEKPIIESGYESRVPLQGLGLEQTEGLGETIQVGNVIGVQPWVGSRDHERGINIGETFVITETGPKPLGTREHIEFVTV